jgi:large repetitive protein
VVRAIADQPNLTVTGTASGAEDTFIPLAISADRTDTDGSEVLSVRITLPGPVSTGTINGDTSGGGSIASQGGGVWLITAPTEAQLDAILSTVTFRGPTNWSGTTSLTVEAIATETGPEILTATASRSSSIAITVGAVVDTPALKLVPSIGGASGLEDQPIRLSITVTLPDGDGSESYVVRLSNQSAGSTYVNGSGTPIGVQVSPGVWEFTPAQLAVLHIRPPLNSNDDLVLTVEAIVTDTGPTGSSVTTISGSLPVNVIGVADAPTVVSPTNIVSLEDQPIPLGANITAALVDTDGSETLYYVIAGLPTGVVPSRGTYIGGEWQISSADMPFVTIPAPANFSGNYVATFAPSLSVRAVSQENDGDEAVSNITVNITITPVVDAFSWSPAVTLPEESGIPLSAARFSGTLPDSDGSEQIVRYTLDLNGIVAAARISGVTASTADFIANHITGPFTDNGDGTITVAAANMAAVSFSAAAFHDSNVDFGIPISARIEESDGSFQTVTSTWQITLDGVADIPTVFAASVSGTAGSLIQLNPTGAEFGGTSTDTDIALGRTLSERIYYIVSGLDTNPGVTLALTNSAGAIVGLDNGDGSWYIEPVDLADIRLLSSPGSNGTVNLTLTTLVVENDTGSRAQSATSAAFDVTILPGSGGSGPPPLPPTVSISVSSANEDGLIPISVTATPAAGDTTNPTVSVMFSNIPVGFTLIGATFNPTTGRWLATAADVNSGQIILRPPANWSGSLSGAATIQVEAVAVNAFLNKATTGLQAAPISVTAVADGPAFAANPSASIEDTGVSLNLTVAPADAEASSPEFVVNPVIITVPAGASLSAGTNIGGNVWHVTTAQLAGLSLTPPANYHGALSIMVQVTTQDVNGDTRSGSTTINLTTAARADIPNATANNVTGAEDTQIVLTGLSANLIDTDGSEVLSAKISGVPIGAIFNAGSNNGDGTWTIPVAALATLAITPPPQFSGVMSLSLIAYSLESSNGDTNSRVLPFTVTVTPVPDIVILDALPATVAEDGSVALQLGVKLEDKASTHLGEDPPEQVEITFTGLPAGSTLGGAGVLQNLGGGSWRFTGTEAQANALTYTPPLNFSGVATVSISAVTIDGAARLAVPATDTFSLTVTAVADAPVLQANAITGPVSAALPVNLFAFPSDADGSESISVTISSVPAGAVFSAGTSLGGGAWRFTQAQLAGLTITLDPATVSTTMTVAATATEGATGATATSNGSIALTVGSAGMNLAGTTAADLLSGWTGNDTLSGGSGSDTLNGGGGADSLIGGTGDDMLNGGTGDDIYAVENAGDAVSELAAEGVDRVDASLSSYALGANVEDLTFVGVGAFTGTGNALDNRLTGGASADLLSGGTGNDTLSGGNGNDTLIGGQGADSFTGGSGADTIRYLTGDTTGGPDVMAGFTAGAGGDVIDIDALLPGYDNNPATLSNYVNLLTGGGNTSVRIDPTGSASFTTTVLTLTGVTGLDLNTLRANGNLVT